MKNSKRFWRALLFFVLLSALCGSFAFPVVNVPVRAAPRMQATSCVGTEFAKWTFTGNSIDPSIGTGKLSYGTGLATPTFAGGQTTAENPSISFSGFGNQTTIDPNDYIEFSVPIVGRTAIILTFKSRVSNTGPVLFEVYYSTDGSNFALFDAPYTLKNDTSWNSISLDFSTTGGIDDNPNAKFRIYAYSAQGTTGTWRLDNVTFSGNCIFPFNTDTPTPTNTATQTGTPTNTGTATSTSTPTTTSTPAGFLSVLINEVAWMGTGASATDEWIELYNPGTSAVNLEGWVLKADDTSPNIIFPAGAIIPPRGFYLLERTNDNTVIDVPANLIYTGELNNSFEVLRLFDLSNRLIDTANSNSGNWPAGFTSSTSHGTMERRGMVADSDTAWITNVQASTWQKHDSRGTSSTNYLIHGTPGYANWAVSVTPTPTKVSTATPAVRTPTRVFTPLPPPQLVVINEFVPRPGHDWNLDGIVNVEDEYVELLNHGVVDVNLSGYTLDDEVNIGSVPYRLPAVTIKPGQRIVFYGSETGLLFSDGGDGVRLLKPNGQLMDAYNYFVVQHPDQSYCRLPDNGGADDWNQNCFPTPGLQNSLSGSFVPPPGADVIEERPCPIADTLPDDFIFAECDPFGHNIWRPAFWDRTGWYDEMYLPESHGKWPVFAD